MSSPDTQRMKSRPQLCIHGLAVGELFDALVSALRGLDIDIHARDERVFSHRLARSAIHLHLHVVDKSDEYRAARTTMARHVELHVWPSADRLITKVAEIPNHLVFWQPEEEEPSHFADLMSAQGHIVLIAGHGRYPTYGPTHSRFAPDPEGLRDALAYLLGITEAVLERPTVSNRTPTPELTPRKLGSSFEH